METRYGPQSGQGIAYDETIRTREAEVADLRFLSGSRRWITR